MPYSYRFNTYTPGTEYRTGSNDVVPADNVVTEEFIAEVNTTLSEHEVRIVYGNLGIANIILTQKMGEILKTYDRTTTDIPTDAFRRYFWDSPADWIRRYLDDYSDPVFDDILKRLLVKIAYGESFIEMTGGSLISKGDVQGELKQDMSDTKARWRLNDALVDRTLMALISHVVSSTFGGY